MKQFNLNRIQSLSPYKVSASGESTLCFVTDAGRHYEIGFIEDYTLGQENCYQFFISTQDEGQFTPDEKIRDTVLVVLNEFFRLNEAAVLYVCDTSDGRQAVRSRLFKLWYEQYADKLQFICETVVFDFESITYYATILIKKGSACCEEILSAFHDFVSEVVLKIEADKETN